MHKAALPIPLGVDIKKLIRECKDNYPVKQCINIASLEWDKRQYECTKSWKIMSSNDVRACYREDGFRNWYSFDSTWVHARKVEFSDGVFVEIQYTCVNAGTALAVCTLTLPADIVFGLLDINTSDDRDGSPFMNGAEM